MKKKLGVLLVRGAGEYDIKKQLKFVDKVNKQLALTEFTSDDIHYEYANWYEPTQHNQKELLERFLQPKYNLKSKKLRKLILYVASDITAYTGEPNKPSNTYYKTHELIHNSIINIQNNVEENAPLIIIASSLATEIISNYIWDRQHDKDTEIFGTTVFERLETLTGIFMLGNDTPIYIVAHNIDEAKPFDCPNKNILPKYKHLSYWVNFYDENDPLGYPMKAVNSHYDKMVTEDIEVNSGNILTSWNVGSHFAYWNTRAIINNVADYIINVLYQLK